MYSISSKITVNINSLFFSETDPILLFKKMLYTFEEPHHHEAFGDEAIQHYSISFNISIVLSIPFLISNFAYHPSFCNFALSSLALVALL